MESTKPITKDVTKEKIILFVIGVLTGAVISTGAFFAYIKLAGIDTSSNQSMQMPGGTPPEIPSGNQSGTPPEMPSGNQNNSQSEAPNSGTNSDSTNSQNGTSSSKSNKTNQSTTND